MKKELDAQLQRYQSRYLTQFRLCYTYHGRRNWRTGGQFPLPPYFGRNTKKQNLFYYSFPADFVKKFSSLRQDGIANQAKSVCITSNDIKIYIRQYKVGIIVYTRHLFVNLNLLSFFCISFLTPTCLYC